MGKKLLKFYMECSLIQRQRITNPRMTRGYICENVARNWSYQVDECLTIIVYICHYIGDGTHALGFSGSQYWYACICAGVFCLLQDDHNRSAGPKFPELLTAGLPVSKPLETRFNGGRKSRKAIGDCLPEKAAAAALATVLQTKRSSFAAKWRLRGQHSPRWRRCRQPGHW